MRSNLVVVFPPALDQDLRLNPTPEPFKAEALVPELVVEALVSGILPWLPRIDERSIDVACSQPLQYRP